MNDLNNVKLCIEPVLRFVNHLQDSLTIYPAHLATKEKLAKLVCQIITSSIPERYLYYSMLIYFLAQLVLDVLRHCLVIKEPLLFLIFVSLIKQVLVFGTSHKHTTRRPHVVARFGYRVQYQTHHKCNDLGDTAKVTEQCHNIIDLSLVRVKCSVKEQFVFEEQDIVVLCVLAHQVALMNVEV